MESTYMEERSKQETRSIMVEDHILKFSKFDIKKEKNGIRLPHHVRLLEADPPCPINLITEHLKIKEELGTGSEYILN